MTDSPQSPRDALPTMIVARFGQIGLRSKSEIVGPARQLTIEATIQL
jgi:hypothetical protein